jgi:hypothetical protein
LDQQRQQQIVALGRLGWSLLIQDVAHGRDGAQGSGGGQRLGRLGVVAGFQVSIDGRFWVSTEGRCTHESKTAVMQCSP